MKLFWLSLFVAGCGSSPEPTTPIVNAAPSVSVTASALTAGQEVAQGLRTEDRFDFAFEGQRLVAKLEQKKPRWVLGEPIYLDFVLENPTGGRLETIQGGDTINWMGRHDNFKVVVNDDHGKALVDPVTEIAGSPPGNSLRGPAKLGGRWFSRMRLQAFAKVRAAGVYHVVFKHDLKIIPESDQMFDDTVKPIPVSLSVQVEVLPPDPEALGKVIAAYGAELAPQADDASWGEEDHSAYDALEDIDDPRTEPYWIALATRGSRTQKSIAVGQLGKFDDDQALDAIAGALDEKDDMARASAALALRKTKSPRGVEILWARRKKLDAMGRSLLLDRLADTAGATTNQRLEEMTHDPDPGVAGEARRYLAERRPKNNPR